MAIFVLPAFSKGVIGPSLHARVDISSYRTGLRQARNCIIHPHGGISNRPGSVCIGPVKDHTVSTTRLLRFHLGDTDQYVLEFGAAYIRFIRNDTHITETAVTVTAATVASPVVITAASHGYSNGDEVVMNAIGGMIEISGGRYIVQRVTTNTFELTHQVTGDNIDGTGFTAFSAGGSDTVAKIYEITSPYAAGNLATLKTVQSGNVVTITHPTYAPRDLTRTDHNAWTLTTLTYAPALAAPTNLAATASTNTNFQVFATRNQTVSYRVTSLADTESYFEESLPITVTLTDSSDPPLNTLTWTAESAADRYAVYRQDNGLYGLVGETEAVTFKDDNFATDLTISPPAARNPFNVSGDFPATSGYYEQRQLYGATTNAPDTWWASQTGLRLNMSVSTPLQADDAITASLSSQDVQVIRHFVPLDDLIVLTNAGEWRINSGGDSSFSSDTVKQKPQEFWGADHMQPIIIGKTIFYVEDGGGRVRSLGYSLQADGYQSTDMNLLANHLLVEDGPDSFVVTDWAHQQFPEPRLYIVRSDGQILTMTFNKEQQVTAWTTWDTQGNYESITSLRRSLSNVEDGLYFIVQRNLLGSTDGCGGTDVRYIERMHTRKFADVRDSHFLDAGYRLDTQLTITDITDANPAVITSAAHGLSDGDDIEITDVNWCPDTDSLGNETNPIQFNNLRYKVANATTDTIELLSHTTVGGGEGWDLPNTQFDFTLDVTGEVSRTLGISFNSDGTKMYISDYDGSDVLRLYTLTTAYDIRTATYDGTGSDFSLLGSSDIFLSDDGIHFYTYQGGSPRLLRHWTLSVAYDFTSAVLETDTFLLPHLVGGIAWSADGTKLYFIKGPGTDQVFEWTLANGASWNLSSTFTLTATYNFADQGMSPEGIYFKPDGLKFYIATDNRNQVRQYDMSTAWDLSTTSYSGLTVSVSSETANADSVHWNPTTGEFLYVLGGSEKAIHQYKSPVSASSVDVGLPSTEVYKDGGIIRQCVTQVTGLHCLEGQTVGVLLDGSVEADYTVANGSITIRDGRCITRASSGIPYTTDIETLNIETSGPPGTIQDKQKKINDVMIRFYKSRMPFIGPNSDDMVEIKGREFEKIGSPTELLSGDKTINIPPLWNSNGRLFIRMRAPVPLTILGLWPDLTVEDEI